MCRMTFVSVLCFLVPPHHTNVLYVLQEQIVMNLDSRLLMFPLYICCNFLYTSPEKRADNEAQLDNLEA